MQLPREVIVGVNILDRVGEICTKQGFHGTALVVSGPVTYPIAGVGVAKSATKAGLRVDHIIVKESTEARWGERYRSGQASFCESGCSFHEYSNGRES